MATNKWYMAVSGEAPHTSPTGDHYMVVVLALDTQHLPHFGMKPNRLWYNYKAMLGSLQAHTTCLCTIFPRCCGVSDTRKNIIDVVEFLIPVKNLRLSKIQVSRIQVEICRTGIFMCPDDVRK